MFEYNNNQDNPLNPIFALNFNDLYSREGLIKVNNYFLEFLFVVNQELGAKYLDLRLNYQRTPHREVSDFLIEIAKILEDFLVLLFNIKEEGDVLKNDHSRLANIYLVKKSFIQRVVAKKYKPEDVVNLENPQEFLKKVSPQLIDLIVDADSFDSEFADLVKKYEQNELENCQQLNNLELYAAWALHHPQGLKIHKNSALFKLPQKINFDALVEFEEIKTSENLSSKRACHDKLRQRDGFKLTDNGFSLNQSLAEANYCIFCHHQGKDSCSTGLKNQHQSFKFDQFGRELSGCPLEEKISEMNQLKAEGFSVAALAIAVVDNPMIAGTGHRICNDCMKSCIYQKQDPVNIPQIETRVVKDVLALSFGFEIYSLLTRWNPLNLKQILPNEDSGYKILIAGLGPAGYTLAHYLINSGHLVVAIDGLKIEPLDQQISGIDIDGNRCDFKPIRNIKEIYEELDSRVMAGFGGVAEYGITARWDKNFLKIIRLLLERRANFRMLGSTRLGSALDCSEALEKYDFDHIALCLGAGWPNLPEIKNNFIKGVRSASDFLMALQLTGAARKDLLANLQIRLPILVVGAGLTAIDTATESLAYYLLQVEKFYQRYQELVNKFGADEIRKDWNEEEKIIANEFLDHATEIKEARIKGENITKLLISWGGAKIIYRKKISESPSYRLNPEEIAKALEEGIEFIEEVEPIEAIADNFNHISSLKVKYQGQEKEIPARALLFALGTLPNKAPFYEDQLKFSLDQKTFQAFDLLGNKISLPNSPKSENTGFLVAKNQQNKWVSFFGDLHPSFNGSVVKAMASAKRGYPIINQALDSCVKSKVNYRKFLEKINQDFTVRLYEKNILSDEILELVIYAPLLARKTRLGHIFRLHNYHNLALRKNDNLLAMEGSPVTAYKVDPIRGLISVMVVNSGGSLALAKYLKVGEPLIFMGPSGSPAHIASNQTIIFIVDSIGIFPMASIALEHKKQNCRVLFFVRPKLKQDHDQLILRQEELEACSDLLVIAGNNLSQIKLNRPNDLIFNGDVVDAVIEYGKGRLGHQDFNYQNVDLIFTMGSNYLLDKASKLRSCLKEELNPNLLEIASLNSPMQCMLKGVCSQCLQKKTDSKTGDIRYFYSCIAQDQKVVEIDFDFLKNRCQQNSLSEKLTRSWISQLLFN